MRARLALLALAACGCNNPTFLTEKAPVETAASRTGNVGSDLYVLPVRQPTQKERQFLATLQQKLMLPDPVPWAQARDFDIEIEYSIKNLDAMQVTAFAYLDGGNEFGDYLPNQYINPNDPNQQTPPPHLVASEPFQIGPGAVITGVFREDDLQESALNLEAITRYPSAAGGLRATPFMVILNRSNVSSIGRDGVPPGDITPAHVRYQLTVAADGHVVLDYTVRVRDHNGKLAKPTDMNLYVDTAAMLAPPAGTPF